MFSYHVAHRIKSWIYSTVQEPQPEPSVFFQLLLGRQKRRLRLHNTGRFGADADQKRLHSTTLLVLCDSLRTNQPCNAVSPQFQHLTFTVRTNSMWAHVYCPHEAFNLSFKSNGKQFNCSILYYFNGSRESPLPVPTNNCWHCKTNQKP